MVARTWWLGVLFVCLRSPWWQTINTGLLFVNGLGEEDENGDPSEEESGGGLGDKLTNVRDKVGSLAKAQAKKAYDQQFADPMRSLNFQAVKVLTVWEKEARDQAVSTSSQATCPVNVPVEVAFVISGSSSFGWWTKEANAIIPRIKSDLEAQHKGLDLRFSVHQYANAPQAPGDKSECVRTVFPLTRDSAEIVKHLGSMKADLAEGGHLVINDRPRDPLSAAAFAAASAAKFTKGTSTLKVLVIVADNEPLLGSARKRFDGDTLECGVGDGFPHPTAIEREFGRANVDLVIACLDKSNVCPKFQSVLEQFHTLVQKYKPEDYAQIKFFKGPRPADAARPYVDAINKIMCNPGILPKQKHPEDEEKKRAGLSGGAIAGIVLGTLAGVCMIAGLAWYVWNRIYGDGAKTAPLTVSTHTETNREPAQEREAYQEYNEA